MRLLLGRDAVRAAAEAERARAEADRKWRSLSESTDFIDDAGQTSNPSSQSSPTGGRTERKPRTWLITGASSGLGYALAEFVLQRGDRVVLAARSMDSTRGLAARFPDTALAVGLDVTDRSRIDSRGPPPASAASGPPVRTSFASAFCG
jgi:hypothetical protein